MKHLRTFLNRAMLAASLLHTDFAIGLEKKLATTLFQSYFFDVRAVANILAQVRAESDFNPAASENLEGYTAKNLYDMFGPEQTRNSVRFQNIEEAQAVVKGGGESVGNFLYGGRFGNGEDEGYKYRGRGLLQLTFKANYKWASMEIYGDLRLVENPDLLYNEDVGIQVVVAYFTRAQRVYDLRDIDQATRAVGPAHLNVSKRKQYANEYLKKLIFGW